MHRLRACSTRASARDPWTWQGKLAASTAISIMPSSSSAHFLCRKSVGRGSLGHCQDSHYILLYVLTSAGLTHMGTHSMTKTTGSLVGGSFQGHRELPSQREQATGGALDKEETIGNLDERKQLKSALIS